MQLDTPTSYYLIYLSIVLLASIACYCILNVICLYLSGIINCGSRSDNTARDDSHRTNDARLTAKSSKSLSVSIKVPEFKNSSTMTIKTGERQSMIGQTDLNSAATKKDTSKSLKISEYRQQPIAEGGTNKLGS